MKQLFYIFLALATGLLPTTAWTCSFFKYQRSQDTIVAKSYDWNMGHGLLSVNKRGLKKRSLALHPGDRPLQWTSRFGSVTFNQYAIEFPIGGTNEAGLSIEILWLSGSRFPDQSRLPTLNESQWVQYFLDTASSVQQVEERLHHLRISQVMAPVHYAVCDKQGDCAVIEWLDGKAVVHSTTGQNADLPLPTLTNSTYEQSLQYAQQYDGFGGRQDLRQGYNSLDRFVRASYYARYGGPTTFATSMQRSFQILGNLASSGDFTKWNIVYNLSRGQLYFRMMNGDQRIKALRLSDLDFSCNSPRLVFNIEQPLEGNVRPHFQTYKDQHNSYLADRALRRFPAQAKRKVLDYPKTLRCQSALQ